ncbi:MAG: hypothetical protein OEW19_17935, partial [Acidobacteriota bacterium]|nr:hypothetical protein [Acidobacteriota bacterium]
MKRAFLLALTVATVFHLRDAGVGAQTPPDTLKFFKNYFVTGDYVAAGVGLRGKGTGGYATDHIEVTGVPAGADIVAAFLYWQVVSKSGADTGSSGVRFNGYSLEADNPATPAVDPEPFGKALEFAGTAPCYNPGGSNGQGSAITWTYRADVLRFFEADFTGAAGSNPNYGKLIVNGPHEVTVPDSGPDGNRSPMALGASLVVIYRVPSMNLSAVVLYDEGVTLANAQRTLVQPMQGFYQASATPNARISYIVGSGQAAKNDYVVVPGAAGAYENVFAATDDDNWDTLTYPAAVAMNASQVQTTISVDVSGGGGGDCLTPAAIVFKADVQDTDGDGLLDVWETAGAPAGGTPQLVDPNGQPLPPLGAMGARPDVRDLFIEIGYMQNGDATYGGVPKPAHSHLPSHAALKKVGDTFSQAPPAGGSPAGIQVHFDVGPDYPAGDPLDEDNNAEVYIIRGRGGEAIDESVTVCDPGEGAPEWACQFAAYPGTVGWKSGFRFLRDQVIAVNGEPAPANFDEEVCGTTVNGTTYACERRFDRSRMNMFHYALFAHAVGLPKSEQACLASDGTPVEADQVTDRCPDGTTPNPEFHTPRTNTGVGDFIGADLMVTLGGFPDVDGLPIGTPFMQASTLLHELGHNFERRHGGGALEPNCKPTYLSVMNYLYQLRGLLSNDGTPNLDFAGAPVGPTVDEMNLIGDVDDARYRLGWYAPLIGSYREGHATAALRHCNGSDLAPGEGPVGGMVRLDASTAGTDIDWDADGNPTTTV